MSQIVFVYGSLKRGFHNHHLLEGSRFVGKATSMDRFAMWGIGFPYLVPHVAGAKVSGELYTVDDRTLAALDRLEGVPHHYRREQWLFKLNGQLLYAYVYLAPKDRYAKRRGDDDVEPEEGVLSWTEDRLTYP